MRAFEGAADRAQAAGRHAEAVGALRQLAALRPQDAAAYRRRIAEALAAEGQTGEAVELLEALAHELERADRHDEAAGIREALVGIDPSVERVVAFARAAVAVREPHRALAALQRAFREAPARLDVLEHLSWAFRSAGDDAKAEAIDRELSARYAEALAREGAGADDANSRDERRGRINEFLRLPPDLRQPALDLAHELAARNPLASDARRTLGTVRALFGDFEGAAYEFRAAIGLARAKGDRELAEEILLEARRLTRLHPLIRE